MRQDMTMRHAQRVPPATRAWSAIALFALLPGTAGLSLTLTDDSLQLGAGSAQAGHANEKLFVQS
jgi:hypothetical protein